MAYTHFGAMYGFLGFGAGRGCSGTPASRSWRTVSVAPRLAASFNMTWASKEWIGTAETPSTTRTSVPLRGRKK